jgi:hypothetical protein
MDPLSAMIGGVSSLIGGFMNTSSAQAINAANLQEQTWSAQGGYLPGLVQNAQAAGLNPLAVLGSRGPNMAVQVNPNPGSGLQQFGQDIAHANLQSFELDQQQKKENLAHTAAVTKQTNIDNAVKQEVLKGIDSGRYNPPGLTEHAVDTDVSAAAIAGSKDFWNWWKNYQVIPDWQTWNTNAQRSLGIPFMQRFIGGGQ